MGSREGMVLALLLLLHGAPSDAAASPPPGGRGGSPPRLAEAAGAGLSMRTRARTRRAKP